jgi:hypothetical protein
MLYGSSMSTPLIFNPNAIDAPADMRHYLKVRRAGLRAYASHFDMESRYGNWDETISLGDQLVKRQAELIQNGRYNIFEAYAGFCVMMRQPAAFHYFGFVTMVSDVALVLDDCVWIADSGAWATACKDGFQTDDGGPGPRAEIAPQGFYGPTSLALGPGLEPQIWGHMPDNVFRSDRDIQNFTYLEQLYNDGSIR